MSDSDDVLWMGFMGLATLLNNEELQPVGV